MPYVFQRCSSNKYYQGVQDSHPALRQATLKGDLAEVNAILASSPAARMERDGDNATASGSRFFLSYPRPRVIKIARGTKLHQGNRTKIPAGRHLRPQGERTTFARTP